MLLYNRTFFILYLYIINDRLEADINKSVGFVCVLFKSSHHTYNALPVSTKPHIDLNKSQ